MRSRPWFYRIARTMGDIEAAQRGPTEYGKRVVRKRVYRHVNTQTRRALRALGLSR